MISIFVVGQRALLAICLYEIQYRKALPKQGHSWIQLIDGGVLTKVFLDMTVTFHISIPIFF